MALLRRATRGGQLPDAFAGELRHGCPTFFPYHHQLYLSAFRELEAAGKPGLPRCVPLACFGRAHSGELWIGM